MTSFVEVKRTDRRFQIKGDFQTKSFEKKTRPKNTASYKNKIKQVGLSKAQNEFLMTA